MLKQKICNKYDDMYKKKRQQIVVDHKQNMNFAV